MKKMALILLVALTMTSCATTSFMAFEKVPTEVNFSAEDFIYGEPIEVTIDWFETEEEGLLENLLMGMALEGTDWDLLLFPKYTYKEKGNDRTLTLIARPAKLKY